ncbi:MAG: histidine phosphatase family protein [Acidobacteriaceae bacterium]|nr:histidine phosphatase family protein [Acidobacteriaceae bacterium]MBV9780651.1 histidine phosphatase family protein [Acidobacteriaceae bacterium]
MTRVLYGRTPGVHLNSEGYREAQKLGEALKMKCDLDAVISSPLERAIETARFVADPQSIAVSIDEGLNEIDFGGWAGKSLSELHELLEWREYNRLRSVMRPPHGESALEVQARAWSTLVRIAAAHQDSIVAVVTHGDVIRYLLILLLGMPLDHILRLEIAPASISEIVLGTDQPIVRTVNKTIWSGVESERSD